MCRPHVHQCYFLASPLACGVVDLIALATTYCYGVEGLEGAQAYTRDGHKFRGKHDQDGLGVVEGYGQVMAHWDHQRVGAAAQVPLTCGKLLEKRLRVQLSIES